MRARRLKSLFYQPTVHKKTHENKIVLSNFTTQEIFETGFGRMAISLDPENGA
jgi:hypothetical protein